MEIHKHLKESLAGRRSIYKVFPLVASEWSQVKQPVEDFFIFGGLPGLIHLKTKNEKIEHLSQMVQAYLLKDIKGLIKEENIRAFNHLLFYLAEHQGQVVTTSNLAKEIGVSSKTIESYLEIMEQTFILYSVVSFAKKMANELKKSKKYYFYDLGIRNSLVKDFNSIEEREDIGLIHETFLLLELKAKQVANVEIRFWRTKQGDEIDFLWIENRVPVPIEVKTSASNDRIPPGMIKFFRKYPKTKKAYVFSKDRHQDVEVDGKDIYFRKFETLVDSAFSIN